MELEDGSEVSAITYFMTKPEVEDKRPSKLYHQVIIEGAKEHKLPGAYIEKLHLIENNGQLGDGSISIELGRF